MIMHALDGAAPVEAAIASVLRQVGLPNEMVVDEGSPRLDAMRTRRPGRIG